MIVRLTQQPILFLSQRGKNGMLKLELEVVGGALMDGWMRIATWQIQGAAVVWTSSDFLT